MKIGFAVNKKGICLTMCYHKQIDLNNEIIMVGTTDCNNCKFNISTHDYYVICKHETKKLKKGEKK